MKQDENKQGTEEWLAARRGKITASEVYNLMVSGKKQEEYFGKAAMAYILKRFASGYVTEEPDIKNTAMQWGIDHEAEARDLYIEQLKQIESNDDLHVYETGFVTYNNYAGCSPDGIVNQYVYSEEENLETNEVDEEVYTEPLGCIEIKCPHDSSVHVETILNDAIPEQYQKKYYAQMQMNMMVLDVQWCDFISYDPRMKDEKLRLKVIRIMRDEKFIEELKERIAKASVIMDQMKNKIEGKE